MKKLRDCLTLPVAPMAIRAKLSRDPTEKTWQCPTCGVIPPLAFAGGWYVRRSCPCEKAAHEAREIAKLRAETAQVRATLTYTWLGRAWSEPELSEKTFASFQRERQHQALTLAQSFAERPQGTLALYGSFGTGKTHLLAAIANVQVERGQTCRFASAVSLFDALQERLELRQDYHGLLRQAISAPLLLLDDVDKLKPSEFREETLYKLLNGRCVAGLPLALSSNNPPHALARWIGKAGRSRLMTGLIPVPMEGDDYRLEGRA
jgi:DNA replication protein DnaC